MYNNMSKGSICGNLEKKFVSVGSWEGKLYVIPSMLV